MLKVYGTKTDPTRPVRPPTTTTTASPPRLWSNNLSSSSTTTTMGSSGNSQLSAGAGVVGPRSGHDSVARSKSGIDPLLFFFSASFVIIYSTPFVVTLCVRALVARSQVLLCSCVTHEILVTLSLFFSFCFVLYEECFSKVKTAVHTQLS